MAAEGRQVGGSLAENNVPQAGVQAALAESWEIIAHESPLARQGQPSSYRLACTIAGLSACASTSRGAGPRFWEESCV